MNMVLSRVVFVCFSRAPLSFPFFSVIPAKAGIQSCLSKSQMDSRLRGSDISEDSARIEGISLKAK